jgi:hypothetical protein
MTVRYAHLAPKHTLAAVEKLDAAPENSTDTTTDTVATEPFTPETVVLQ